MNSPVNFIPYIHRQSSHSSQIYAFPSVRLILKCIFRKRNMLFGTNTELILISLPLRLVTNMISEAKIFTLYIRAVRESFNIRFSKNVVFSCLLLFFFANFSKLSEIRPIASNLFQKISLNQSLEQKFRSMVSSFSWSLSNNTFILLCHSELGVTGSNNQIPISLSTQH